MFSVAACAKGKWPNAPSALNYTTKRHLSRNRTDRNRSAPVHSSCLQRRGLAARHLRAAVPGSAQPSSTSRRCPRPRIDPKEEEDDEYNYNDGDADTLGYRAEYGTHNFSASIKVDGKPAGPFHLPIHCRAAAMSAQGHAQGKSRHSVPANATSAQFMCSTHTPSHQTQALNASISPSPRHPRLGGPPPVSCG